MALRTKTMLILGLTLITLIVIIGVASDLLVEGGFARVEDQAAEKDTHRALVALADDINTLDAIAVEWASRGTVREFLAGSRPGQDPLPLDEETFNRLAFNYIIISNASGSQILGRGYDLDTRQTLPVVPALSGLTVPSSPLRQTGGLLNGTMGIVQTADYPLLVAVRPVISAGSPEEPAGYITMARRLDSRELARLSNMAQLSLTVRPYSGAGHDREIDAALIAGATPGGRFLTRSGEDSYLLDAATARKVQDADTLGAYALVQDVYGEPALVLAAGIPRDISQQGTSTMLYFLSLLLVAGIGVGVVMVVLLEHTVLSRLLSLSSHVSSIGDRRDFSARVNVLGDDEITELATTVNSMLGELEKSQQHLQVRLNQSEENYRLFFNSINDMVVVVGSAREGMSGGEILEANDSAVITLSLFREELGTIPFSTLIPMEERERVVSFLEQVGRDRQGRIESLYRTSAGRIIPVEMSARAFDLFGREAQLVIARDITERRDIEQLKREAFQQIEKNMQQFAILNDHIRNPLQGIVGTADLIGDEHAARIIELARTINGIVDQLDRGYLESEKIQEFLRKYYGIDRK